MNGSLAVEAHGTIDYERGGDETYDVDVDARGLMLDERVSQALDGPSRELFNSLVAEGSADLAVAIKRKKGEAPGPRVDITVDLGGVSLWPQQFPLDFADARGPARHHGRGPDQDREGHGAAAGRDSLDLGDRPGGARRDPAFSRHEPSRSSRSTGPSRRRSPASRRERRERSRS